MSNSRPRWLLEFFGPHPSRAGHVERLISGLGAVLALLAIQAVSSALVGPDGLLLVTSMGAAAVLLFANPHGPLSQPWPLFCGNLISAVIGVACTAWIPWQPLAASLAVGLAITAMHYARCIHPPGGATALAAVIGGPEVHALGFGFVIPVAVNVLVIFLVAVAFNGLFPWRRYPASLAAATTPDGPPTA